LGLRSQFAEITVLWNKKMSSSPSLQQLRRQLREQFPEAHRFSPLSRGEGAGPEAVVPSGVSLPSLDPGTLVECSPAGPASGLSLLLAALLEAEEGGPHTSDLKSRIPKLALIDGRDCFDPASYGSALCSRLLWVRCHHAKESLRCTDLLLRDGNLPLLVLDLLFNSLPELRRLPASSWYRLRHLAERSGATLLVLTPRPFIPSANQRFTAASSFSLDDLDKTRETLPLQLLEGEGLTRRHEGTKRG